MALLSFFAICQTCLPSSGADATNRTGQCQAYVTAAARRPRSLRNRCLRPSRRHTHDPKYESFFWEAEVQFRVLSNVVLFYVDVDPRHFSFDLSSCVRWL